MTRRPRLPARLGAGSLVNARFVGASLVDALGTGCFLAGSAIFFTREVGLSAAQVGIGLTLSGAVGLLATVPWGRAADRWGARRILVLLLAARAVAFLVYAFVSSFAAFLAITAFLGLVEKATSPIQDSLLGDIVAKERRQRALAVVRSTRNVGFALGAVIATATVTDASIVSYDAIVMLNAVTFVFAAILIGTMSVIRAPRPAPPARSDASQRVHDRRFGALTAVNGALTLHMTLLSVGLPLWLLEHTSAPAAAVPALLVVNTVLAVALQVPLAGRVRSPRGAVTALTVAGTALAVCCLAMPLAATLEGTGALAVAIGAVLALTLAEMAQAAGGWDLSFRLAPEAQRGRYLSVFSLGTTAQMVLGPVLLTSVVFELGTWGWVGLAAVLLGAGPLAGMILRAEAATPVAPARASGRSEDAAAGADELPGDPASVGSGEERQDVADVAWLAHAVKRRALLPRPCACAARAQEVPELTAVPATASASALKQLTTPVMSSPESAGRDVS